MSDAGRKNTFTKKMLDHVAMIPGGVKSYRNYLERTALLTVDDLARLGLLQFHPRNLSPEAISKLIYLWKSKNLTHKTLANRLSALRKIANTTHPPLFVIPANQTFKIKLPEKRKVLTDLTPKLNPYEIQNKAMQSVCLLQFLFGLTKFEAIRSFGLLITPEALIIPRKISFNKIERRILTINNEQRNLLVQLNHHPLTESPKLLSLMHHETLKHANIKEKEYFRLFYIVNRYKQLIASVSMKEALKQVQLESGFASLRQIKGVLLCLEDF